MTKVSLMHSSKRVESIMKNRNLLLVFLRLVVALATTSASGLVDKVVITPLGGSAPASNALEKTADSIITSVSGTSYKDTNSTLKANNNVEQQKCGIYFAPSTIPGAGMGMFAAMDYKKNDILTPGDIVIPLVDFGSHNSHIDVEWLVLQSYWWQTWAFTGMSEECEEGFAFSPGVGAAVNCFFPLVNIQGYDDGTKLDGAGLHRSRDPGAGAFTPYHGRYSYAIRDIQSGEELFTDYGENYFSLNPESFGLIPLYSSYDEADKLLRQYVHVRNQVCPSDDEPQCHLHEDWYSLVHSLRSLWPSRTLNALPEDATVVDHIAQVGTSWTHYNRSIRSTEWLQEHGHCADHLEPGTSTIPQAGRGAFARRFVSQGEVLAPMPVVHVNRSLMDMYPTYYNHEGLWGNRSATVRQQQLLLNYCFGHDRSIVLLCPYGMLSSLINHSKKKANAKLEWNYKLMRNPEWLEQPVEKWLSFYHVGLMLNFVATRDIQPGEEIFFDYGDSWEAAWSSFVTAWTPPKGSNKYLASYDLNENPDTIVRTVAEGGYSSSQVEVFCFELFRVWSGLKPISLEYHHCRAIDRYERSEGEQRYTAELYDRYQEENGYECYEELFEVLFDVPRDAFWFVDAPYSRDAAQPWSFRHPIGIPDNIMPPAWIQ